MTSRERLLAALNFKETGFIPIDLGSNPSSGISAAAYSEVLNRLNIKAPVRIYDVVQQLALPGKEIIDHFGIDVIDIAQFFCDDESLWKKTVLHNGREAYYPHWFKPIENSNGSFSAVHRESGKLIAEMPDSAWFYDQSYFPWESGFPSSKEEMAASIDDAMDHVLWSHFVHSPWDLAKEEGFWESARNKVLAMREKSDKAFMIVIGCNLFEWGTFLRRIDNFLMDLYIDKENVSQLMELLMERHMKTIEKVCQYFGDIVDVVRFGDDLGMDSGPFMGLEVYKELFHHHRKKMSDYVHANSQMKIFLHSCGSIYQFIPDLIESGIDIINPVQTNCLNMEPQRLKSEFGKDIVFWGGGIDTRSVLNRGSVAEVKKDLISRLEILAPGGGFVFNTVHNILPDVPAENIIAMFEALRDFNEK